MAYGTARNLFKGNGWMDGLRRCVSICVLAFSQSTIVLKNKMIRRVFPFVSSIGFSSVF